MLWMYLWDTQLYFVSHLIHPPAFPRVCESTSPETVLTWQRGGPVYMSTPVPAPRHTDNKTNRHEKQTDRDTRHRHTDTHSPDRGGRVYKGRQCWWIYLSWKTMTFQHSKQTFWHFLICWNCDIESLPKYGLAGKECVAASALCPNMVMDQNLPGNCTMVPS